MKCPRCGFRSPQASDGRTRCSKCGLGRTTQTLPSLQEHGSAPLSQELKALAIEGWSPTPSIVALSTGLPQVRTEHYSGHGKLAVNVANFSIRNSSGSWNDMALLLGHLQLTEDEELEVSPQSSNLQIVVEEQTIEFHNPGGSNSGLRLISAKDSGLFIVITSVDAMPPPQLLKYMSLDQTSESV